MGRSLTVGSLFSGVGGFDQGFRGFDHLWLCENEPTCKDVLAFRYPNVRLYDDVRTVNWEHVERPDIIFGGFPCQDLSVAGRRAGLDGERSGLFFEFIRVIDALRPALVVIENVPGLLSSDRGRDMAIVLGSLRDSGARDIAWRVLDAQWFGVAQRRRRLFLVADFAEERASKILALPQSLSGHPAPSRETGEGIAGTLGGGSGERGWRNDLDTQGAYVSSPPLAGSILARHGRGPSSTLDDHLVAMNLSGNQARMSYRGDGTDNFALMFDERNDAAGEHVSMTLQAKKSGGWSLGYQPVVSVRTAQTGANGVGAQEDASYTLDGAQGQAVAFYAHSGLDQAVQDDIAPPVTVGTGLPNMANPPAVAIRMGGDYDDPTVTLDDKAFLAANPMSDRQMAVFQPEVAASVLASHGHRVESQYLSVANTLADANGLRGWSASVDVPNFLPTAAGVRRLTPVECERLMGWPDDWTKFGASGRQMSDSTRYRMCGNGVVAHVAAWIAEGIRLEWADDVGSVDEGAGRDHDGERPKTTEDADADAGAEI